MKRYIYIILLATVFAGCIKDNFDKVPNTSSDGSVSLNIAVPAPVQRNMNTRAVAADFNELSDLNVIIAQGGNDEDEIVTSHYFENLTTLLGDPDEDDVAFTPNEDGTYRIHFSGDWLESSGVSAETATFFLVANYGEGIDITTTATVGALRNLKDVSKGSGLVNDPGMMFAEAEPLGEDDEDIHGNEHPGGISLKAELTRTVAMITVAIDGSGLAPNVIVEPLSVSLYNVPKYSVLGGENTITVADVSPEGESRSAAELWGTGVFIASQSPSNVAKTQPTVGAHYGDDYTVDDIEPLFLYENIHGDGFGAEEEDERWKRPASVARNRTDIENAADTKISSYLQIDARYHYVNASGVLQFGGTVSYRVFLGGNLTDDFDVKRNTYYKFTLTLGNGNDNSYGISEGGYTNPSGNPSAPNATWRMITNLSSQSVLSESDFVLNSGGEMIFVDELMVSGNQSNWHVAYQNGANQANVNNGQFLWGIFGSGNSVQWRAIPTTDGDVDKHFTRTSDDKAQFRLYVEPMGPDDGAAENEGYMRQLVFRFYNNNDYNFPNSWITITQYAPIVVELNSENTSQEIQAYVTEVLQKTLPLTIYFDRVDRDGMPWGFDGVSITANQNSGFENGRILAVDYQAAANNYRPFGIRTSSGDNSAMMHAAFMNYYNRAMTPDGFTTKDTWPNGVTFPSSATLANTSLMYEYYFVPNSIPSRAEWKLLEMLDNELEGGLFDKRHPVSSLNTYWTSDAVLGDNTKSYVYRLGHGELDLDEDEWPAQLKVDRTTPVRYRMVSFKEKMN